MHKKLLTLPFVLYDTNFFPEPHNFTAHDLPFHSTLQSEGNQLDRASLLHIGRVDN